MDRIEEINNEIFGMLPCSYLEGKLLEKVSLLEQRIKEKDSHISDLEKRVEKMKKVVEAVKVVCQHEERWSEAVRDGTDPYSHMEDYLHCSDSADDKVTYFDSLKNALREGGE